MTLSLRLDESGQLRLKLHVLGIPLYRTRKKQSRVRLSRYSKRAMARRKKKQARLHAKHTKRAAEDKASPKPPPDKAPLTDKIAFITDLSSTLLRRSFYHARVRVDSLTVTVGTPDAAKTAILCGVISPALAFLLETLKQFSHVHISPDTPVGVAPDFTSEQVRADIRLHFRLHVVHLVDIALHALVRILRHSTKRSKH